MKANFISGQVFEILKCGKGLLAFSGGADSSALFFILESKRIDFDIAIVDYGIREQSKQEVNYAKNLAKKYNKKCHVLESKNIDSNFESEARRVRYNFFYHLIEIYGYTSLITAHHFDDRLEWFFMRLCLGAGLNTLLGFNEIESRFYKNIQFYIARPLINIRKNELLEYNKLHNIDFFYDKSNEDSKYLRNFFRINITNEISTRFYAGIKKSFEFMQKERESLYPNIIICKDLNLFYCKNNDIKSNLHRIFIIDNLAKRLGYVMSVLQKSELDIMFSIFYKSSKAYKECILGNRIIIAINKNFLFVAQQIKDSKAIPKDTIEIYRKEKIPPKIRKVMYFNSCFANP